MQPLGQLGLQQLQLPAHLPADQHHVAVFFEISRQQHGVPAVAGYPRCAVLIRQADAGHILKPHNRAVRRGNIQDDLLDLLQGAEGALRLDVQLAGDAVQLSGGNLGVLQGDDPLHVAEGESVLVEPGAVDLHRDLLVQLPGDLDLFNAADFQEPCLDLLGVSAQLLIGVPVAGQADQHAGGLHPVGVDGDLLAFRRQLRLNGVHLLPQGGEGGLLIGADLQHHQGHGGAVHGGGLKEVQPLDLLHLILDLAGHQPLHVAGGGSGIRAGDDGHRGADIRRFLPGHQVIAVQARQDDHGQYEQGDAGIQNDPFQQPYHVSLPPSRSPGLPAAPVSSPRQSRCLPPPGPIRTPGGLRSPEG